MYPAPNLKAGKQQEGPIPWKIFSTPLHHSLDLPNSKRNRVQENRLTYNDMFTYTWNITFMPQWYEIKLNPSFNDIIFSEIYNNHPFYMLTFSKRCNICLPSFEECMYRKYIKLHTPWLRINGICNTRIYQRAFYPLGCTSRSIYLSTEYLGWSLHKYGHSFVRHFTFIK